MDKFEANRNLRMPETSSLSSREAIEKLVQLQGQVIDLPKLLQTATPHHAHFGDVKDLDKRPPHLLTQAMSVINIPNPQAPNSILELQAAHEQYLAEQGIKATTRFLFPHASDTPLILDAIFPQGESWDTQSVVKILPMVDFLLSFSHLKKAKAGLEKKPYTRYYSDSLYIPKLFINTTQVSDNSPYYKVDLQLGPNTERDLKGIASYLMGGTSWFALYSNLGITNSADAYELEPDMAALVGNMMAARV